MTLVHEGLLLRYLHEQLPRYVRVSPKYMGLVRVLPLSYKYQHIILCLRRRHASTPNAQRVAQATHHCVDGRRNYFNFSHAGSSPSLLPHNRQWLPSNIFLKCFLYRQSIYTRIFYSKPTPCRFLKCFLYRQSVYTRIFYSKPTPCRSSL